MDLIFAKDLGGGNYIFRGVYVRDDEKSRPNHDVSKRIATKVRLIGDPTNDIELIDEIEPGVIPNSINIPMSPKRIIKSKDGSTLYECGRCGIQYSKAPRCPECGQLVKE